MRRLTIKLSLMRKRLDHPECQRKSHSNSGHSQALVRSRVEVSC